ncbi:MAG: DUF454 domain-containing protein, partial [Rhizobiaceae bacterium]|nr:DUF454 domain-containing protein [Rhizobiaceae bacterium]
AKIASVSLMTVSYGIVLFVGPPMVWLKLAIGTILLACAVFVLTRPQPTV